ncbi:hypothetical protein OJ253_1053 [Cryptosporidium canis]|uniref:Uncharacterized protein n=1 Tax=Cryptosporidium canis TaxID=195482 RepID=A0A9D5HZG2_9CRYT|nr:hypothetical protein OJ253_1053 [Cryptosporidium canis]
MDCKSLEMFSSSARPWMVQQGLGGRPHPGVQGQEGVQEQGKVVRLELVNAVLVDQNGLKVPILELRYLEQFVVLVEELPGIPPRPDQRPGELPKELDHLSQMVIVAAEVLRRLWSEQKVASQELENGASQAPNVRGPVVARPNYHLGASVLSGLNVLAEVLIHPAGIPEIDNQVLRVVPCERLRMRVDVPDDVGDLLQIPLVSLVANRPLAPLGVLGELASVIPQ